MKDVGRKEAKGSESWCFIESGVENEGEKDCENSVMLTWSAFVAANVDR